MWEGWGRGLPLQQRSMDKCCMIHHVGMGYKEDNNYSCTHKSTRPLCGKLVYNVQGFYHTVCPPYKLHVCSLSL